MACRNLVRESGGEATPCCSRICPLPGNPPMPLDGERMIFGGFEPVVEVKG